MTPGEFAAIEARLAAATEGPWMVDGDDPTVVMKPDKPPSTWDGLLVARTRGGTGADIDSLPEYADAEFIAHAREDVPALLAAVRERDNTIARVREVADKYASARWRQTPLSSAQQAEGMNIAADAVLAALDPQETP